MTEACRSRRFWNHAAQNNAAWYVSTGHLQETEEFFRQGAAEADAFLAFCDVAPQPRAAVLEIGCGVGRMTLRLAELFGSVTAVDVSEEMLRRCRDNLRSHSNVIYRLVDGDGFLDGIGDGTVDVVFSYITFQHLPSVATQLRYFEESARVLKAGGKMAVQIRSTTPVAVALSYAGHLAHLTKGRRTLNRSWRGSRVKASAVVECLRERGVSAMIRPWTHHARWSPMQWWVVGTKS